MTKQITAFYHQACTYLSSVKLPPAPSPSTKEIALVAITLFAIYKIYKKFQSLENRVTQLEQEKIEQLTLKLTTAEGTIKTLSESIDNLKNRKNSAEKSASLSDYESCEDNDEVISSPENHEDLDLDEKSSNDSDSSNKNSKLEISSVPVNSTAVTPLEQFKQMFPGRELKHNETNFADFFLSKILRMDENPSCIIETTGHFKLNYTKPKIVLLSKIPESISNKLSWLVKTGINSLLKITPGIQLSNEIKGQIIINQNGCQITFDPSAILLMENTLRYTAHLKSITVFNSKNQEGHFLHVDSEHNSSFIDQKGGSLDHQIFAEFIELNFSQHI